MRRERKRENQHCGSRNLTESKFFFFFVVPTRDRSPLYLTAYVKLMHVAFDENLMEIDFAVSNLSSMPFFSEKD